MSKICCIGDADVCPKSSSCSMILRSACSHRHSRESSTSREKSRSRSNSKRKLITSTKRNLSNSDTLITSTKRDLSDSDTLITSTKRNLSNSDTQLHSALELSLKQLAIKSAKETYSLLKENFYNSFEVSEKVDQNVYEANSLDVSCAKQLHFSQLSTSGNSFNLNGSYRIECSSDYSSAAESDISSSELLNTTSNMAKRYTRSSVRNLSDDESDISVQRITRFRSNTAHVNSPVNNSNATILSQKETSSHHILNNNNHSPYISNYSEMGNHLGQSTGTLFDRFRWFLWRCTYLKVIRTVNFDVWFLSRVHKYGRFKVMFFLLLPLLFYLLWGSMQSISDSSAELSETMNSIFSLPLMLVSSVSSYFTRKETVSLNPGGSDDDESCILYSLSSYFPSFSGILSIFSGLFIKTEESASSLDTTYVTKEISFQSNGKGSLTEDEIRLLVTKVIEENNLFQRSDNQRAQFEMGEREKKLQTEIRNLRIEFQSFSSSMQRIEENILKDRERSEVTESIITLTDEQKRDIDHLNLKISAIETKLKILEELRNCCNKQLRPEDITMAVEKHLITAFRSVIGGDAYSDSTDSKYRFFNEWINSKFLNLENLLQEVNVAVKKQSSIQPMSSENVIGIVNSVFQNHVNSIKRELEEQKVSSHVSFDVDDFSEEKIKKIVKEAIMLYDADKTGKVDYALESGGGSILGTRCSETYEEKYGKYSLFGLSLWSNSNSPRVAIQPDVHPGHCWAFKGSQGFLVIELSATIYPTGFTMEHIPVSLSPTENIDSAPKKFSVWGLESEKDSKGILLGEYMYDIKGDPLQYFAIEEPTTKPYSYIELQIESNHGHMEYTCLYRFRVHGHRIR